MSSGRSGGRTPLYGGASDAWLEARQNGTPNFVYKGLKRILANG
jgi:hypothetical protein